MNQVGPELVTKAFVWCRQYLRGAWATLEKHDFHVEVLSGTGLSNYLFICSIPSASVQTTTYPNKVLLRIHGEILDNPESALIESVTCALLADRKLAPKIFGIFSGGRIEEYIPSRNLRVDEVREERYSIQIAKKLAMFHSLELPLQKEPIFIQDACVRWLSKILDGMSFNNPEHDTKFKKLLSYGLENELHYVEQLMNSTPSPSVFCHNDLNEGNVLLVDGETKGSNIMFIDFEYASYNYRGFDIANHFCEWALDYTYSSKPYFLYSPENYPTKEEQLTFIRAYLSFYNEEYDTAPEEMKIALESNLLTEIKRFTLPCHFFWALWGIIQEKRSHHQFGHLDFALTRMHAYLKLKEELTTHVGIPHPSAMQLARRPAAD
ncbi:choline/ethanolamine kinase-like isoform X2 [Ptychodera flava]|uniref:choline/ethanolamine kinase-like isoform X2 n=1 Tax=Ptychodera flava TaxID=63121 RepID=UPI00396A7182